VSSISRKFRILWSPKSCILWEKFMYDSYTGFIYNFCYGCSKTFCMILDKKSLRKFLCTLELYWWQAAVNRRRPPPSRLLPTACAAHRHSQALVLPPVCFFSVVVASSAQRRPPRELLDGQWRRCLAAAPLCSARWTSLSLLACHACPPSVGRAATRLPRLSH
jgi:hypothetical protein